MKVPLLSQCMQVVFSRIGLRKRSNLSLRNLQNANKTFAISIGEIAEPLIDEEEAFSQVQVSHYDWKHTWSSNRDFRKSPRYRSLRIKGKMYALPCGEWA